MSIWFGANSLCPQDVVRGEDKECKLKTGDLKMYGDFFFPKQNEKELSII